MEEIKVYRRRGEEYQCYCPNTNERTPSMFINPKKDVYHCFSCGESGKASILLQTHTLSNSPCVIKSDFTPVQVVGEESEGYQYMLGRGFQPEILETFGVVSTDQYVLIPVRNRVGDTVGLIYRNWMEGKPKYIYTEGFKVSRRLFGTCDFMPRDDDVVLITEGALDVMWLHQHGFRNVVAIFGTSLSDEQAVLLRRLGEKVCICFDNDEAGKKGVQNALKVLMKLGMQTTVLQLPDGVKDLKQLQIEELMYVFKHNITDSLTYLLKIKE